MHEAKLIENWFADHNETDDFWRPERAYAYEIIGPTQTSTRVIYCTKKHVTQRIVEEFRASFDCGIISHYGLPLESDINWLLAIVATRELFFLGDMDPTDIMIFGWLRSALQSIKVVHLGINDKLNARLGYTMPENHRIALSQGESTAVSRLEKFVPDVSDVLGNTCHDLLRSGFKIELEALLIGIGNGAKILDSVLEQC
jgi:hypothetical protein